MGPSPGQKSVLITGCTPGGIGAALCLEFHERGVHVIATARNLSCLDEMAAMGMSTLPLDVTDKASIATCHEKVKEITGGGLDFLVNNAGRTHVIPATDIDLDDVRATFEANVFGVMAMVAAFADQLIAARGLIVNICSTSALTPYVFGSVYTATKGAVVSYTRTLRLELAPFGVRVMGVMAGTVRSNSASHAHRTLPPDSLYQRVADVFQWRLTFSQNHGTMKTDEFAERLVANVLAPETPVWLPFLNRWIGRKDWYWDGGMAQLVWAGQTFFGEWLVDAVCWRMFKLARLKKIVDEERKNAKKTT